MGRIVQTTEEYIATVRAVCEGNQRDATYTAIAAATSVGRERVSAIIEDWKADGRSLEAYLAALEAAKQSDERSRQQRESARLRKQASRAQHAARQAAGPPRIPTEEEMEMSAQEREKFLEEVERIDRIDSDAVKHRMNKIMGYPASEMTSGAHDAWTLQAILMKWPQVIIDDESPMVNAEIDLATDVPLLLRYWGWHEDADGVWTAA